MTLSSQISYVATLLKDSEMAYWKMIEKIIDDAEMFTSEVHDPYARTTGA